MGDKGGCIPPCSWDMGLSPAGDTLFGSGLSGLGLGAVRARPPYRSGALQRIDGNIHFVLIAHDRMRVEFGPAHIRCGVNLRRGSGGGEDTR